VASLKMHTCPEPEGFAKYLVTWSISKNAMDYS
jgi:hypothetical protein